MKEWYGSVRICVPFFIWNYDISLFLQLFLNPVGLFCVLQEMKGLQTQSGGDVNVEVNATPGINLMEKLNEMRCEYERLIENNRKEVESWYETKVNKVF